MTTKTIFTIAIALYSATCICAGENHLRQIEYDPSVIEGNFSSDVPKFKKKHASVYREMGKQSGNISHSSKNDSTNDQPVGMDYRNPFILKNKTADEVKKEQEKIIGRTCPSGKEALRMIWLFNNRYIERISLNIGKNKFGEDQFVILNFDITAHMQEYLKSHQVRKTKMSEKVIQIEK